MDNLTARIRRFYSAHYPDLDDRPAASVGYYVGNDAVLFEGLYRKYVAPLRATHRGRVSSAAMEEEAGGGGPSRPF